MSKKKQNVKIIPSKNYLIALLIVLATFLLTLYGFEWHRQWEQERLSQSYLITSEAIISEITSLYDLENWLDQPPSEFFLYISYTNSRDINRLERELASVINDYLLHDEFIFLNVTDEKDNANFFHRLNTILDLDFTIDNLPIILYFRDQLFVEGVTSPSNEIIRANHFRSLITQFDIERN